VCRIKQLRKRIQLQRPEQPSEHPAKLKQLTGYLDWTSRQDHQQQLNKVMAVILAHCTLIQSLALISFTGMSNDPHMVGVSSRVTRIIHEGPHLHCPLRFISLTSPHCSFFGFISCCRVLHHLLTWSSPSERNCTWPSKP
jgi:hypothetical protein